MKISKIDRLRFESKIDKTSSVNGCWLWLAGSYGKRTPYGAFWYKNRNYGSHVFSYLIFKGNINKNLMIRHNCPNINNKLCCNPEHLLLGTAKDNKNDEVIRGLQRKGSDVNTSKLTEGQILEIRAKYRPPTSRNSKDGYSYEKLAKEYGVDTASIFSIVKRKTWKHI